MFRSLFEFSNNLIPISNIKSSYSPPNFLRGEILSYSEEEHTFFPQEGELDALTINSASEFPPRRRKVRTKENEMRSKLGSETKGVPFVRSSNFDSAISFMCKILKTNTFAIVKSLIDFLHQKQ